MHSNIQLERHSPGPVSNETLSRQLHSIRKACQVPEFGCTLRLGASEQSYTADGWVHSVKATMSGPQETFRLALATLRRWGNRLGWLVVASEPESPNRPPAAVEVDAPCPDSSVKTPPEFQLPQLNLTHFAGVHERDSHIRLIHDAAKTCVTTSWRERSHVLLYGQPAAAKTTLFERFTRLYDSPGAEHVVFLDGATMTKAGLENWLLSQSDEGTAPEFLVIEEIEKQSMDNLLTLLSLMASGKVVKTNAKVGR